MCSTVRPEVCCWLTLTIYALGWSTSIIFFNLRAHKSGSSRFLCISTEIVDSRRLRAAQRKVLLSLLSLQNFVLNSCVLYESFREDEGTLSFSHLLNRTFGCGMMQFLFCGQNGSLGENHQVSRDFSADFVWSMSRCKESPSICVACPIGFIIS